MSGTYGSAERAELSGTCGSAGRTECAELFLEDGIDVAELVLEDALARLGTGGGLPSEGVGSRGSGSPWYWATRAR